jgi:hypothetical protein
MHASRVALSAAGRVALSRRRPLKAALEITESAAVRLRTLLAANPSALGIRVGVKSRACSRRRSAQPAYHRRGERCSCRRFRRQKLPLALVFFYPRCAPAHRTPRAHLPAQAAATASPTR